MAQTRTSPGQNFQDNVLAQLRDRGAPATLYLNNRMALHGRILDFDPYVLLLEPNDGGPVQMIYKSAVVSVAGPPRKRPMGRPRDDGRPGGDRPRGGPRDRPYGARDRSYGPGGPRDRSPGTGDRPYGSGDRSYGSGDRPYGSGSGPRDRPYRPRESYEGSDAGRTEAPQNTERRRDEEPPDTPPAE